MISLGGSYTVVDIPWWFLLIDFVVWFESSFPCPGNVFNIRNPEVDAAMTELMNSEQGRLLSSLSRVVQRSMHASGGGVLGPVIVTWNLQGTIILYIYIL